MTVLKEGIKTPLYPTSVGCIQHERKYSIVSRLPLHTAHSELCWTMDVYVHSHYPTCVLHFSSVVRQNGGLFTSYVHLMFTVDLTLREPCQPF